MSVDKATVIRQCFFQPAVLIAVWLTPSLSGPFPSLGSAAPEPDQPWSQAEEEYAERVKQLDAIMDGRLLEHLSRAVDGKPITEDYLRGNPEFLSGYRDLLVDGFKIAGWDPMIVRSTAPPRIMFETLVDALQPGGELEGLLVKVVEAREDPRRSPGKLNGVDDILEKRGGPSDEPDYRIYKEFFKQHPVEYVAPFIEYMLRQNPYLAMDVLLEVYPKELNDPLAVFDDHQLLKRHKWGHEHGLIRSNPIRNDQGIIVGYRTPAELLNATRRLSRDEAWWVRLYVLSARRGGVPDDMIRQLRNDPHPAVRRAAEALKLPEDR